MPPLLAQTNTQLNHIKLAAVFGPDSRNEAPYRQAAPKHDSHAAENRVGTIEHTPGEAVCTAVCIQPNRVLTAAHCLADTNGGTRSVSAFKFHTHFAQRSARIIGRLDPPRALNTAPPITAHNDWTILGLSKSICPNVAYETPATLPAAEKVDLTAVYQLGFHRDKGNGERLVKSNDCALDPITQQRLNKLSKRDFAKPQAVLFHHCDNAALSSGAPLFRNGPKGPELIAINIGTYVRQRTVVPSQAVPWRTEQQPVANTAIPMTVIWRDLKVGKQNSIQVEEVP